MKLSEIFNEIWKTNEALAECGEIHMGMKFIKQYDFLKASTEKIKYVLDNNEWIKCKEQLPPDNLDVLVSNQIVVSIGDYNSKRNRGNGEWAVVGAGATLNPDGIVQWKHLPKAN